MKREQAFVFDLDGTLVDSVYQHVLAWQEALDHADIEVSVWPVHRRIGMSGGLLAHALLRETGRPMSPEDASRLRQLHADAYRQRMSQVRVLPGAWELLARLSELDVPWAIATSGYRESAGPMLELLGVAPEVPVITRDAVDRAKPDPDLFLAAAARLDQAIPQAMHPDVRAYLVQRGMDPSQHHQRRVSAELLSTSDLVIAMSTDHQSFLFDTFQYRALLFNDVCHGRSEPLLDVWEAVPGWETDLDAARRYAFQVMEHIWASIPCLLQNLGMYLTVDRTE
jgi:beta-phosphoglucomutase-like phosphatase (HAD superfamily)